MATYLQDQQELEHAVDREVRDVLERAKFSEPPVDAFRTAAALGVVVARDESSTTRARTKRLAGRSVVYLRPDDRPERLQWALAHELGEIKAPRLLSRLDEPDDGARERLANLFATRLLLPTSEFEQAVADRGRDLPGLKRRFDTASHELVARRLLDLAAPCTVTVFDNGRLTLRRSNRGRSSLQPAERRVLQRVRETREAVRERVLGGELACWPVVEPGWQRELLVATGDDDNG